MLQVANGEATRGLEPSIQGGQVAEIQGSRELGGSQGKGPSIWYSKSRDARSEEEGSRWIWVAGEPSDLHVGSCIGVS
jgi:hypothetical protein